MLYKKTQQNIKTILSIIACLFFFMAAPSAGLSQDYNYEIILKNGRSIKVAHYTEENGIISYVKFGSTVGIEKSEIEEIKAFQDSGYNRISPDYSQDIIKDNSTEDPFSLYHTALTDKQKGNFDAAEKKLNHALTIIEPGEANYATIKDEQLYHLPFEKARSLSAQGQFKKSLDLLQQIQTDITGHSRKFEYLQKIHDFSNSILHKICTKIEYDAFNASVAIADYFAYPANTRLPSNKELYSKMGYTPANRIEISGSVNDTVQIIVHDATGRCPSGKRLVFSVPGGMRQWQ